MKRRSRLLTLVLVCALTLGSLAYVAHAATWIGTATVDMAGAGALHTYIWMTETGAANWTGSKMFECTDAKAKEMLATALTAISSGLTVSANVDLTTSPYKVMNVYLKK